MELKRKIAKEFYASMFKDAVDELPAEAWQILKHVSHKEMCRPLILKARKKGATIGQLKNKYGLSERQIKYILINK